VLVKVVDIFGNDTTKMVEVRIRSGKGGESNALGR